MEPSSFFSRSLIAKICPERVYELSDLPVFRGNAAVLNITANERGSYILNLNHTLIFGPFDEGTDMEDKPFPRGWGPICGIPQFNKRSVQTQG